MPPTSVEARLDRLEQILTLVLHTFDGPTDPTETTVYRLLLLHELRTDVCTTNTIELKEEP